jgi:signal transduction histidine kinase
MIKIKLNIQRTPEIIYGLRNFIGNAVKFSKSKVKINLKVMKKIIEIKIMMMVQDSRRYNKKNW